jgi:hypothetical protein
MELNGKMQTETNLYRSRQERYRQCHYSPIARSPMAIMVTRDNGRRGCSIHSTLGRIIAR